LLPSDAPAPEAHIFGGQKYGEFLNAQTVMRSFFALPESQLWQHKQLQLYIVNTLRKSAGRANFDIGQDLLF
jgi:hypothetical protein